MIDKEKFKLSREMAGLSQAALGKKIGASQQLITSIETGEQNTTKLIYKIAVEIGVPAHELDDEIPPPDSELIQYITEIRTLDEADQAIILASLRANIEIAKKRGMRPRMRMAQRRTVMSPLKARSAR